MPDFAEISPGEALLIGYDFSNNLSGETLVSSSNINGISGVKVFDSDGIDVSETMIESNSLIISNTMVQARILNVEANKHFSIKFYAALTNGDFIEGVVLLRN
jgi:hypothetical protein